MQLDLFILEATRDPLYFFAVVFTVIFSITLHELAHGWAAVRRGDQTPIVSGHMTLDPWVHMGPWSLIMLLLAGVAWGQMPIDPTRIKGKYGEAAVAFAGPAVNLLLAFAALTIVGVWFGVGFDENTATPVQLNLAMFLNVFGFTNLFLFVFNLMPVPPLDGAHILANFNRRYAQFIYDPQHQGVMMLLFAAAFVCARGIMVFVHDAGRWYLHIVERLVS